MTATEYVAAKNSASRIALKLDASGNIMYQNYTDLKAMKVDIKAMP